MRTDSWVSPKCEVRRGIAENGVFAVDSFRGGELIAIFGGTVLTAAEDRSIAAAKQTDRFGLEVCEGYFLSAAQPGDVEDADMFNHSCDPNAGVKGQILLLARRDIVAGEEITFDYETTDISDMKMVCRCGSPACRKELTGEAWKNPAFREKNSGWFSWYVQEKIDRL